MATLDPRDSQRRGRSVSPGGRERSRSRGAYDERDTSRGRYRDASPNPSIGYSREDDEKETVELEKDEHNYTEHDRELERREIDMVYGEEYAARTPTKVNVYGRPQTPPSATLSRFSERSSTLYDDHQREQEWAREREARERSYNEEKKRERSSSFNVSAGLGKHHASISGGLTLKHDSHLYSADLPSPGLPGARYGTPASPAAGGGYVSSGYGRGDSSPSGPKYAEPSQWKYAKTDEKITYNTTTSRKEDVYMASERRTASPPRHRDSSPARHHSRHGSTSHTRTSSTYLSAEKVITVGPGSPRRDASPARLGDRLNTLTINTGAHHGSSLSVANAPGSPLLEAYRGTYQSASPMPSPIINVLHSPMTETFSPLSPTSDDERPFRRTARFHDSADEAAKLRDALKGDRTPDVHPLLTILPGLTHDQILDLRVEYKKIVKTGHERKGVNIAKHIKLRLKDEDPSLMKACYATALGRWESEAYWANFWYQGEKSRRELLIESLMGRTNKEIRAIKEGFSDKKYKDSLEKCMRTELKEDKFKKAVLLVLEERRMEESRRLDEELVREDIRSLEKAVSSERGGESRMIEIVCLRSDGHLREVLRGYERTYGGRNFTREMLRKSGNLVVCFFFLFSCCRLHAPASVIFPLYLRVFDRVFTSFLLFPPSPSPQPSPTTPLTPPSGRTPSPHPQRRNQQAGPRRHPGAPRAHPIQTGPSPHRAAD
jgi:hypothetical protein